MNVVVKNSRITFENTLDKLPFELKIFVFELVEKTSEIDRENKV